MPSHFILPFTGYSMYPHLKPGDRLVVKHVPPNSLRIGDIVITSLSNPGQFMAHRLIKIFPDGKCLTKGDALLKTDTKRIELSRVEGKVTAILRGPRLISLAAGPRARIRGVFVLLSRMGLTYGAIKQRIKNFLLPLLNVRLFSILAPRGSRGPGPERAFILSMLREGPIEALPELDWPNLVKLAYKEGVAGMLYLRLKAGNIPEFALSAFENYYHKTAYMNLIHIQALGEIEQSLRDEKIEVLTLKGASLLDHAYPRIGIRFMEDLDLMVKPNDYERFVNFLIRLGYKKKGLLSHLFVKGKVAIDLHTHALHTDRIKARNVLFPEGMGPVWASAKSWKPGFLWLKRPDDADHILLLSQHLLQHSFSRLIWFEDIRRLINRGDNLFWEKLKKKAHFHKQQKSLSFIFHILKGLFDYNPPRESGLNNLSENISGFERILLNLYKKGQPVDRIGLFLRLFSISGFKDRIRFGSETLMPKKEVLEKEFGRSSIMGRAFFYPLRIFQMGALLVRLIYLIPGAIIRSAQ